MPLKPDLVASTWIKAVREALGLTQSAFAEQIGAADRDAIAKWESGARKDPGFTYTRRIVTIAPPELVQTFIGQTAGIDTARKMPYSKAPTGDTAVKMKTEAQYIAERLNAIDDDAVRIAAMEGCSKAISKALREAQRAIERRSPRAPTPESERATPRGRRISSK